MHVDLGQVLNLCLAIIMIAIAVLFAVAILKGAYDIWMRDDKGDK